MVTTEVVADEYSIWLLPQEQDARRLDEVIGNLAPIFGIPSFPAHVTIQGDLNLELGVLRCATSALAEEFGVFDWSASTLAMSSHYFRSLYIALQDHPEFSRMQACATLLTGQDAGLAPFPHLSLAYGEPSTRVGKRELIDKYAGCGTGYPCRFDRLAVARSSKNIPIGDWALVDVFPLRRAG
jgi:hypothetical protein